ncbi:unnamed protein product, partial [Brassica oleracea var. botrytis]
MYSSCNPKQNFVFPRSFISNSFLRYSTIILLGFVVFM